jgi:glycine/D-amino acid oxidase-like deaminating enzyme
MKTNHGFDVVIAGGGIVGTACAAACSRAGMRVVLVERDAIGCGATGAGMGHVVVMADSEAQVALTRYSQNLWRQLAGKLSSNAEYDECGTLWLASDAEEFAEAERKHGFYLDHDVPSQLLTAQEIGKLEPNLRPGLAGGLLVPEDAVVNPAAVALHLAHHAEANGSTLMLGRSVLKMAAGEVILDDGTRLTAQRLVNAAAAWAPSIDPDLPIRKSKGHLIITEGAPGFVRRQLVELGYLKSAHSIASDSVAFNIQPRGAGQFLIGSSRQYDNESLDVDQHVLTAMLERAAAFMPALATFDTNRVRTGFRAATPDKLPLIGLSPGDDSVWLATGHEGLGVTTSLATADLLVSAFSGCEPAIPVEPYLPARYPQLTPKHNQKEQA